ncbi:MAG: DUF3341 domain-containing protein [Calditrichaeota bacterium]|nr:DUF3341 domain-containing protein [Calditrichota bacterium]
MAKETKDLILGYFEDPHDLLDAGNTANNMGYMGLDAYSPYPIHGIEKALGIKKSWVPAVAKTFLTIGVVCGFSFQYWVSKFGWALNVGGKPFNSWPAFVPVTFESAIFFCGAATIISVFISCNLKPAGTKFIDRGFTDDKMALVIPADNDDEAEIVKFLKEAGSYEIIKVNY